MKVIIVGCGRMGSGLARVLGMRGYDLTVVDNDPAAFARLGPSFNGITLLGFGLDQEVLQKAGIQRADGVAAVTGSDEVNIVVARLARQWFHVLRVVARLYDPRKAEIYRRLGITTIAPVNWGVTRMADSLVLGEMNTVCSLGDAEIETVELELPSLWIGRRVSELSIPGELQVTAVRRRGKTMLAAPGMVFETGDVLYINVVAAAIDRLKATVGLY